MSIKEFGKLVYRCNTGKMRIIQPKSFTQATGAETTEVLELLMKGEYTMIHMAVPVLTFKKGD